jgi:hypothetical protein
LNKALLDTDISSEILKAVDQTVTRNAIAYRQFHGILTVADVTTMEIVRGHFPDFSIHGCCDPTMRRMDFGQPLTRSRRKSIATKRILAGRRRRC